MGLKYSVTTVFLHDLDMAQILSLLSEQGVDGVEWRCRTIPDAARDQPTSNWGRHIFDCNPDWLLANGKELGTATREAGLEVAGISPALSLADLESYRKLADGAALAGCPLIRVPAPAYQPDTREPWEELFARAVDQYARVIRLLAPRGIRCAIETHVQTLFTSPSLALRLAEVFTPQEIGIIWDVQNAIEEGYELPRLAVSLLGPYLAHVHIGGRRWLDAGPTLNGFGREWRCERCRLSEGALNVPEVLAELRRAGFAGYVSLEDYRPGDPSLKVQEGLADLRAAEAVAQQRLSNRPLPQP